MKSPTDFLKVFYAYNHGQGRQDGEISSLKTIVSSTVRKFAKMTYTVKLHAYLEKHASIPKSGNTANRYFFIVDGKDMVRRKKPPILEKAEFNDFSAETQKPALCCEDRFFFSRSSRLGRLCEFHRGSILRFL